MEPEMLSAVPQLTGTARQGWSHKRSRADIGEKLVTTCLNHRDQGRPPAEKAGIPGGRNLGKQGQKGVGEGVVWTCCPS